MPKKIILRRYYNHLYIYIITCIDNLLHCLVPPREISIWSHGLFTIALYAIYLVFLIPILVLQYVLLDIMILGEVSCCSVQYGISVSAHHIQDCIYPTAFTVPS